MCKIFEDINKYNSRLTETELLACTLFNETNFDITNTVFKAELIESITNYYTAKSKDEILNCYKYNAMDIINAHDFITGFQNILINRYSFFEHKTDINGLPLLFKLYKLLYKSYIDTFTSDNVNEFISKISCACKILHETIKSIFTDKINKKLFNTTFQTKLEKLEKNNVFVLLSSIIGFTDKKTPNTTIKNHLAKCLLYHFMVSDLKNKDKREDLKNCDSISYKAGGGYIDNVANNLLKKPEDISEKLTKEKFDELINELYLESNIPYVRKLDSEKNKNDKRRPLNFFQKTMLFFYYKERMPINMLDNEFSIEHIYPNSSEWDGELDKDRTGNLIPIIASMNSSRGNRHINCYSSNKEGRQFCDFIKDIIPSQDIYNKIIYHEKKPFIQDNELYNMMCHTNEERYKQNFIKCLFR